jgi:hypothetical protein
MNTELATRETNAFLSYAKAVNQRTIVGDILRFSKGDWTAGQNEEEIDEGTRFVAVMDQLMIGWQKWEGGKPTEQEAGLIVEGYRPPSRKDLGDSDETLWERDDRGDRRDPWQKTNWLILKEADGDRVFTFAPSSRGGLSAIGQLCEQYGKMIRQKPEQFPIVAIETSSYRHDTYGKIKVPVLKVVGWADKAGTLAALEAGGNDPADAAGADDIPF